MEGWTIGTIETLCEIGDGNHSSKYPKTSEMIESGIPFIRGTNIVDGQLSSENILYISPEKHKQLKKGHLKTGDVLFTNRGEIGKVAIVDEAFDGANLNSQIAWLRPGENILPKYLFYFLQSQVMRNHFEQEKSGSALQQFTIKMLKIVKIFHPNLSEQQRIVAILDQVFADIEQARAKTEQNLKNARELFESYLQQVFSGGGDGWIESELGKHVKFIDYRGKTPIKTESGVKLITAKNIRMGFLKSNPEEFIAAESYDSWMTRGIPRKGDVLFTTEAPLANVAQLDTDEKVAFAQRVIIMQPDNSILDSEFLKYSLMSQPTQTKIHDKGTGATATGIKASLLKKIPIEFPVSLGTQRQYVATLNSLTESVKVLEKIYFNKLSALDELKKSILQQAFTGQLTNKKSKGVSA